MGSYIIACRKLKVARTPSISTLCSRCAPPFRPSQPTDGEQALNYLHPGGGASGPPREAQMQRLCYPGILRNIVRARKENDCACRREFAANALSTPQLRFENMTVLGKGGFGTVYRGRCKETRKEYAIKRVTPVSSDGHLQEKGCSSVWRRC